MSRTDDEPIQLDPPFQVKLRNGQAATITHYVSEPEPWQLMGHISTGERALWTRHGRFAPPASHSLDITMAVSPDGSLAIFQCVQKAKKGIQP